MKVLNNRKILYLVLSITLICIFTLTIAYAALNTILEISGTAEVASASWDIHLDNVKVNSGSTGTTIPTITSATTASFTTTLNAPGDYYQFTIDVVNDGDIDAMIDSVTKTPTLTTDQAKYINYIVEYENGESISTKQLVQANSYVRLKVLVEYRKDISTSDLPNSSTILNLSFKVNYTQSDDTGNEVTDNGRQIIAKVVNGNLNTIGSEICIAEECFYVISNDDENIAMLAKHNLNENLGKQSTEEFNIYYFTNNYYWDNDGLIEKYGTSYPAYVYDNNSSLYNIVENYKAYLTSFGIILKDVRLISYEELEKLGCKKNDLSCNEAPSFIYTSNYWTGTAETKNNIWHVDKNAGFQNNMYLDGDNYESGIRPVIEIPISEF